MDTIKSRYLEFDRIGYTGKTDVWDVLSKSQESILGKIKWFGRLRWWSGDHGDSLYPHGDKNKDF